MYTPCTNVLFMCMFHVFLPCCLYFYGESYQHDNSQETEPWIWDTWLWVIYWVSSFRSATRPSEPLFVSVFLSPLPPLKGLIIKLFEPTLEKKKAAIAEAKAVVGKCVYKLLLILINVE